MAPAVPAVAAAVAGPAAVTPPHAPIGQALSPATHAAIGAFAGGVECCIFQPTVAWKNAMQDGRPLPFSPRELYRGGLINVASIAPITCVQFGTNRFIEGLLLAGAPAGTSLSTQATMLTALAAGGTSALLSCPAELIMIQQQRVKRDLVATASAYLAKHGFGRLYRGWTPTLTRESIYTCCYLGFNPVLRERLESVPSLGAFGAWAAAGVASGLLSAVVTQPFDTIKTRMQANVPHASEPAIGSSYGSTLATARTIVAEGGLAALYSGLVPRGLRLTGAVFVLSSVRERVLGLLGAAEK